MKKLLVLSLSVLVSLFVSCSSDDDSSGAGVDEGIVVTGEDEDTEERDVMMPIDETTIETDTPVDEEEMNEEEELSLI